MTEVTKQLQVQIALADAAQSQMRAAFFMQRVNSGMYKDRLGKVFYGSPESGGQPLTEEELLRDEMATVHQHIRNAEDHLDHAKEVLWSVV